MEFACARVFDINEKGEYEQRGRDSIQMNEPNDQQKFEAAYRIRWRKHRIS